MKIIDISRKLTRGMAVWPGDTPFDLKTVTSLDAGETVNLTTLQLSTHTGSHVDAPFHFTAGGSTIDRLELNPFWGLAQLVTVAKETGPLTPDDFAQVDLSQAPRLLVHSKASAADPMTFTDSFVYPSPELARHLSQLGIILYGTDAPSMDAADSQDLDGHLALQKHQIAILEGLDLSGVSDGLYELVALPLKIIGGDGSPVRAALRTLD